MKIEKSIEMLKKVKPPEIFLELSKAKLRQQLLDNKHFKKKPLRKRHYIFRYAFSTAAVIGIVMAFVLFKFLPREVSAKELINNLEAVYNNSFVADKIHYIKTLFKTKGEHFGSYLMETWKYQENMIRIMFKNETNDKIIGHVMYKENKKYELQTGKKDSNYKTRIVKKDLGPGRICADEKTIKAYRIMVFPTKNSDKTTGKKKKVNILMIKDNFDVFGFCSQTPRNIFDKLKADPYVEYIGSEIDINTHKKVVILERKSSPDVKSFQLEYEDDIQTEMNWFIDKLRKKEIKLRVDPDSKIPLEKSESNGNLKLERINVVETTKIEKETGKIFRITYSLYKKDKLMDKYELTFLEDRFVDYDPEIFNHRAFGLKIKKNES
jgi:hypothetical protein